MVIQALKKARRSYVRIRKAASHYRAHRRELQSVEAACRAAGVKTQREFPVRGARSSDTLFVLGSGASIKRITEQHWQEIAGANTFGINFWYLHPFVPTFYSFEVPHNIPSEVLDIAYHNHRLLQDSYLRTYILAKGDFARIRKDSFARLPGFHYFHPMQGPKILFDGFWFLKILGHLSPRRSYDVSFQWRGSVAFALHFALVLGYQKVVLCGVDLNNTDYFYEDPDMQKQMPEGLRVPPNVQPGAVHKTNDSSVYGTTLTDVIAFVKDRVFTPQGRELYVAFRSSALYPTLDSYFE